MRSIKTEIIISAPRQKVWQVLTDFASYPEWNPFVYIKGKPEAGTRLENTMMLEGRSPQVFRPTILKVEEAREFRWLGQLYISGLFDGEHYFLLEAIDEQTTRLVHGENFRGILTGTLLKMIGGDTQSAFEKMNRALKERVEALAAK